MATTTVFCRNTDKHDSQSFYMEYNGERYYLFTQNYKRGVATHFRNGVRLDDALDFTRAKGDRGVLRVMEKLPMYIKYIEDVYGVEVLRKTARKNAYRGKRAA